MNKKLGVLLISCLILVGISSLSTPIKEIKACTSESSPPTSYIYAMGSDGPVATLYKIDLSTFNNVSTLYFPNSQVGDNLATYGNYIYADTLDVPSQIYKIALNSFSEVSEITLAPGQGDGNYMVAYNGSLYVGLGTDPTSEPFAAIVKVDLSTFTETAVLPLEKG
ncbi:MAG TPA: hypothetical protein VED00_04150, partial [archaeon]|nr:hypothetical protein [archaeon]